MEEGQARLETRAEVNSEFESTFARLRSILEPHAARLKVTADTADHYCLEVAFSPQLKEADSNRMAIVKHILHAHGSEVWAAKVNFCFTLSLREGSVE